MSLGFPIEAVVRAVSSDGTARTCRLRCDVISPHRIYRLQITPEGGSTVEAEASDCFEALRLVRREFDADGIRLGCAGARRDVWASGMARDMGQGLSAYVLSLHKTARRPPLVGIFDPVDIELVGTVEEQEEFYRAWLRPRPSRPKS